MNIEHTGRVNRVGDRRVFVTVTSNSACGTCEARKACGLSETAEKVVEVETDRAADYAVGDEVTVAVRRRAGMRAVVFAYALPLAVLVAALVVAKAAGAGDGAAAGVALGAVALYYALLRLLRDKISEGIKFTIHKI